MTCGFTFEEIDGATPQEIATRRAGLWREKRDVPEPLYTDEGKPRAEFVKDRPHPWPFGE